MSLPKKCGFCKREITGTFVVVTTKNSTRFFHEDCSDLPREPIRGRVIDLRDRLPKKKSDDE